MKNTNNVVSKAKEVAKHAIDEGSDFGDTIQQKALHVGSVIKEKVQGLGQDALDKSRQMKDKTDQYIKNNPYKFTGIAFLAGLASVFKITTMFKKH